MKRLAVILLILGLAVAAIYLLFGFMSVAVCDGWYDLTVDISPEVAEGISTIAYIGANNAQMADFIAEATDEGLQGEIKPIPARAPFVVSVGFSFRQDQLGRTWGYVQEYSDIVVVLHYVDGSRVVHRVPVPDKHKSRLVALTRDTERTRSLPAQRNPGGLDIKQTAVPTRDGR